MGPVCESGDFLAKDRSLPEVKPGDLLAVMSAGAYGFVMASNYNSRPRVPEVLVKDGEMHVIRTRETYDDLVRRDDSGLPELKAMSDAQSRRLSPVSVHKGVAHVYGSLVAIVTPFRNGKVDERAFGDLIEWQIANGTNGIVPCGTTGESATLSHEEHHRVIDLTVEVVKRRVPVIAGTGSNSTEEAMSLTKHAKEAGADGALLITPYYNKPTQEGLYRHYKAIAEAVDIPQMLYNIPGGPA